MFILQGDSSTPESAPEQLERVLNTIDEAINNKGVGLCQFEMMRGLLFQEWGGEIYMYSCNRREVYSLE